GSAISGVIAATQALRGALGVVGGAFGAVYGEGVRFQASLEAVEISIRSLVANNLLTARSALEVPDAFRIAAQISAQQLERLRVDALSTAATFEELASAYQEGLGAGMAAGFSPDQVRELTVAVGQFARALGMPGYQLPQEIRAILSGQIDRNARVGMSLFA
ncbi:MAG: hypothetical protein CFK52_14455, partial [Chloracidobacterium sp. CP2_5A]